MVYLNQILPMPHGLCPAANPGQRYQVLFVEGTTKDEFDHFVSQWSASFSIMGEYTQQQDSIIVCCDPPICNELRRVPIVEAVHELIH